MNDLYMQPEDVCKLSLWCLVNTMWDGPNVWHDTEIKKNELN